LLVEQDNRGAVALYSKLGFHAADFDPEAPGRARMLLDSE
jgi:ribosomal protein S18 acetylase RimI-like enzyme